MKNQYTTDSLKKMISVLEIRQEAEGKVFKEQLLIIYENFKPSNILKNVVKEFYSSENLKDEFITTAISVTSGLISKRLVIGKSNNQILKLAGLAIQLGITTLLTKKMEVLKDAGVNMIRRFLERKGNKEEITEQEKE